MKPFTDQQLADLEKSGAKVRRKKKATPKKKVVASKPPPKPAQAPPGPQQAGFAEKAITMTAANISVTRALAEEISALTKKMGQAPKPSPYIFTIERDQKGRMTSVKADPVK